ncbi:chaperonin [Salmonella enterica subsp. enterica serovar Benue]|nr:chaperonin [Salmonella enterica subsp. enterica serovar Chailey]EDR3562126.1 chaperonin [Salmonella enterica subsp. enterica serovar Benue]EGG4120889.1 chaperonin [Salmonella enterica]EGG4135063.1 chaperonin [Salmonella enterica]EHS0784507.1 chaperonin [Salmonella enterica]
MKDKKSIYDVASALGEDAPLQVSKAQPKVGEGRQVKTKTLKAIPLAFFDAHQKLRNENKTGLDFSNYIIEAIREKLEKDGAI